MSGAEVKHRGMRLPSLSVLVSTIMSLRPAFDLARIPLFMYICST